MDVTAYINPELMILVPALYLIGMAFKRSKLDDRDIPIFLGCIGILLACLYGVATLPEGANIGSALFASVLQGIFCASAAVYVNQTYKQTFVRED